MINPNEDRRPPLTPQLALRVAVLGSVALAFFAIIFFRLWFLQVLSGDRYLAQAQVNRVRDVAIPAPRGEILDRSGTILVDSRPSLAVQISPPDLPKSLHAQNDLYRRLARILGKPTKRATCHVPGQGTQRLAEIPCAVAQGEAQLPYANVTVATDVSKFVLYYISERQGQFSGVQVQQVWLRSYPFTGLAAQLFGTVGRMTPAEVSDPHYRGASQNDVVGQSGLEWYYDRWLRGRNGKQQIQVNALGNAAGELPPIPPVSGHSLKLSLDLGLQKAGQAALQQSINSNYPAPAGAFVAMSPQTGEVYAMGSLPTFNPNIFAKPVPAATYRALNNPANGYPLFNRAIQSAYPTGSTFKGITSTAALQSGVWSLGEYYNDTGTYQNGATDIRHNAGHASYGTIDIVQAIKVSSDNFFYNLGRLMNSDTPAGGALQQWARKYGIGRATGIDLGGENAGILPSPAWRAQRDRIEARCERRHHVSTAQLFSGLYSCGIADGRPWSVGDNENLAVGQGDLEATPIQLAVAYSAIENGGAIVRPHVGAEIDAADGSLLQKINPPPVRQLHINPQYLAAIHEGLHEAASSPGGTSADVFVNWPQGRYPVYGKTGTAQRGVLADQAWYVCYVPDPVKPILIAVTVEQGGFGAVAAAPVARELLSQWFLGKPGPFVAGASHTL